jgi:hypothetical protein
MRLRHDLRQEIGVIATVSGEMSREENFLALVALCVKYSTQRRVCDFSGKLAIRYRFQPCQILEAPQKI